MRGLSGIRAGLLGAAGGGALATALALAAMSSPAAASCSPTNGGAASGTQTCTGGDAGITYTTSGPLIVNLNNDKVTGLLSITDAGGSSITLNQGLAGTYSAAAITSSDVSGYAVRLISSAGGNINFTSITGGTIAYNGTASAYTLGASTTGSGAITFTTGDAVTNTSTTGSGIGASVVNGALVINAGGTVTTNGYGIYAQSTGTGAVTVNAGANVTANGYGIYALGTGAGAVTVNAGSASAPVTIASKISLNAILAQSSGSGAVTINDFGNASAVGSAGLLAASVNGALNISASGGTVSTTTYTSGGSTQNTEAIGAYSTGSGNILVTLGDGEIVSSPIAGVVVESATGTVGVTEGKNTSITAAASAATINYIDLLPNFPLFSGVGIFAASGNNPTSAANTAAVVTGSGDSITVTGDNTAGIAAENGGSGKGGASVTVGNSNTIAITGGDTVFGVAALAYNTVGVNTGGVSFLPNFSDVMFSGSGNASITLGNNDAITIGAGDGKGGVFPFDAGLVATSAGGNIAITTGSGGTISVTGFSGITTYGIYGTTAAGGAVNITSGSAIKTNNGPAILASTGTGAITIVNNGTLTGNGTAIQTNGGVVSVTNNGTVNGLITTTGASTTSISNTGTWILANATTNTISGNNDAITNSGTLTASGTVALKGQTSFTNTGLIDLHSANGAAGDALTINGAYTGGGKLSVDAALGTSASGSTCGALADCLNIGSSSGTTTVVVNNTATFAQAGLNNGGILIVNGASAAGNFMLDPSSANYNANSNTIDQGLYAYSVAYGSNQVRLVGGPSAAALEIPALIGAIQGTFYSSNPVSGRLGWLRDTASPAGGSDPSTGVWVDSSLSLGSNTNTASLNTGSGATTVNVGYNQQSYSASLGGDIAFTGVADDSDELVLGVVGGFVGSDVAFGVNPANGHVSGGQVGGYGGWFDNNWFINADVLADLMTLKYSQNGASLLASNPAVTVLGGNADAGKRLMLDDSIFIEPMVSLAGANLSAGDTAAGTATVHFGNNASFRGGLGARAGAYIPSGGLIYDLSLTARAWDEFDNQENASLIAGTTIAPLTVSSVGTYGEFVAGLKVMNSDSGFGGYLNGTLDINGIYNQLTVSAGLRYQW